MPKFWFDYGPPGLKLMERIERRRAQLTPFLEGETEGEGDSEAMRQIPPEPPQLPSDFPDVVAEESQAALQRSFVPAGVAAFRAGQAPLSPTTFSPFRPAPAVPFTGLETAQDVGTALTAFSQAPALALGSRSPFIARAQEKAREFMESPEGQAYQLVTGLFGGGPLGTVKKAGGVVAANERGMVRLPKGQQPIAKLGDLVTVPGDPLPYRIVQEGDKHTWIGQQEPNGPLLAFDKSEAKLVPPAAESAAANVAPLAAEKPVGEIPPETVPTGQARAPQGNIDTARDIGGKWAAYVKRKDGTYDLWLFNSKDELEAASSDVRSTVGVGEAWGRMRVPSKATLQDVIDFNGPTVLRNDFAIVPPPEPVPPTAVARGEAAIQPPVKEAPLPVKAEPSAAAPLPGGGAAPRPPEAPVSQGTTPPAPATPGLQAAARQPRFTAGERAANTQPAIPPRTPPPPEPPAPTGPMPSGRAPGGAQNIVEQPPVDDYQRLKDALTPTKVSFRDKVVEAKDSFLRHMFDRNQDLKALERETGIPAYKLTSIVPGSSAYGEDIVRRVYRPAWTGVKKDAEYLDQYMTLKASEDVLARNPNAQLPGGIDGWKGVISAEKKLEQEIGTERYKALQEAADALYRANDDNVLKALTDEGIISKESYTAIKSAHPHYIPFQREDFADMAQRSFTRPEANVSSTGIKRMTLEGSVRPLDRTVSLISQLEAGAIRAQNVIWRNRAAKGIVQALQELEQATGERLVEYIEPKGAMRTAYRVTGEKVARLKKGEHSALTETISFFQNGEKVTVQVPGVYGQIAKGLDSEPNNLLMEIARYGTAPLRQGATTYNPAFMAVVNPIMNATSAFWTEKLIPFSPDYVKGLVAAFRKNQLFSDAAENGVLMSGIIENMRNPSAIQRVGQLGAIEVHSMKDALLVIPRLMRASGENIEQATRIAVYSKLRAQGLTGLEAGIRARNATVDFSKMGTSMKVINAVLPFTNAGLQGAVNTLKVLKDNPKWAAIASTPFLAATALARVNNMRFDTSNQIPDSDYTNYWVFQVAEGTMKAGVKFPITIKVPKGPVAGPVTFPVEAVLNLNQRQNDRSAAEIIMRTGSQAVSTFSPIPTSPEALLPPGISTAVQLQANKNLFTGQPIVPESQQNLPASEQFTPKTSDTAIAIGKAVHISPEVLDFAINDYTAGAGQSVKWLLGLGLDAAGWDMKSGLPKLELTAAEKLGPSPIGRFIGTRANITAALQAEAIRQGKLQPGQTFEDVGGSRQRTELTPEGRAIIARAQPNNQPQLAKEAAYDRAKALDDKLLAWHQGKTESEGAISPKQWRDTMHEETLKTVGMRQWQEQEGKFPKRTPKNDNDAALQAYYQLVDAVYDRDKGWSKDEASEFLDTFMSRLTSEQGKYVMDSLHPNATRVRQQYYEDMRTLKPWFDMQREFREKMKKENLTKVLEEYQAAERMGDRATMMRLAPFMAVVKQREGFFNRDKELFLRENEYADYLLLKWGYRKTGTNTSVELARRRGELPGRIASELVGAGIR